MGRSDPSTASVGSQPLLRTEAENKASKRLAHRRRFANSTRSLSSLEALRASCLSLINLASALSAPAWCSSKPSSPISASPSSSSMSSSLDWSISISSCSFSSSSSWLSCDSFVLERSTSSRSTPTLEASTKASPSSSSSDSSTSSRDSSSSPPSIFSPQTDSIKIDMKSSLTSSFEDEALVQMPDMAERTPDQASLTVSRVSLDADAWIWSLPLISPPTGLDKILTINPEIADSGFSFSSSSSLDIEPSKTAQRPTMQSNKSETKSWSASSSLSSSSSSLSFSPVSRRHMS
mmetsp:Transcript_35330/g.80770  ORF Transcript_35330/g.80770 Transcript_35330/m.80770 type:complete len:292 (+) Transcript_35330:235-1110(+)